MFRAKAVLRNAIALIRDVLILGQHVLHYLMADVIAMHAQEDAMTALIVVRIAIVTGAINVLQTIALENVLTVLIAVLIADVMMTETVCLVILSIVLLILKIAAKYLVADVTEVIAKRKTIAKKKIAQIALIAGRIALATRLYVKTAQTILVLIAQVVQDVNVLMGYIAKVILIIHVKISLKES